MAIRQSGPNFPEPLETIVTSFAALASFFAATAFLNVPAQVDPERREIRQAKKARRK